MLEKLSAQMTAWDTKTRYTILASYVALVIILMATIIFFYYRSINYWTTAAEEINAYREKAHDILQKAVRVYNERAEVNKVIQEDPDFKIVGYLQDVLTKQNIAQFLNTINTTQIDREDNFREIIANVSLTGITMKQLTEFLNTVEQNKRLYIKELEITKSKKQPKTIDVVVLIATMQLRQASLA